MPGQRITRAGWSHGVAAYLIWKHWDTIKGAFRTAGGWLGSAWASIKSIFAEGVAFLGRATEAHATAWRDRVVVDRASLDPGHRGVEEADEAIARASEAVPVK